MLNINLTEDGLYDGDMIVVFVDEQKKMDQLMLDLDRRVNQIISRVIDNEDKFKGKFLETQLLTVVDVEGELKNILIMGLGDESEIKAHQVEKLGGKIYKIASANNVKTITISADNDIGEVSADEVKALLASGAMLASYKFDKYQTQKKKKDQESGKIEVTSVSIIGKVTEKAEDLLEEKKAEILAVFYARNLISEVPNILYPESYAESIVDNLGSIGVDVEVLGEKEMRELGMGALLGVGQGSARESKMVIMRYNGLEFNTKPVCFVGKGVTFDTGGISLKPSANMHDMKYDMGGSAAVVGAIKALALRGAKVNAVGIVGLVENMPGGNAQRPGDVVTTMSGQTVEVLNTDAEGRLVLADCVTYLQKNFEPECIVDLATLTGAISISLASTYAGLFSNNDELSNKLISSSVKSDEKLWRMPLHSDYDKMIDSTVADVANIGNGKGHAGSSTAAHFIQRFIEKDIKWAHLDIAGMAWERGACNPICPAGAVGFGVKLLNQFVKDHYEGK